MHNPVRQPCVGGYGSSAEWQGGGGVRPSTAAPWKCLNASGWGKKEAQQLAARTAAVETPWEELLERHAALTASDAEYQ
jgi:hypothetical protein